MLHPGGRCPSFPS